MSSIVNKKDIITAFKQLGIQTTDTIIVHSSFKSFGMVDGGAETVIDGIKEVVSDGTIVFPALRSRNFYDAYTDWDVDKTPSDVGYLTEFFRKSPNVYRSNQETHSVCAFGKNAKFITENHGKGKNRIGVFGDTPFSISSPWQKMFDLDAKVVMIGVSMSSNTFMHFVEYKLVNDIIDSIKDEEIKQEAISKITRFKDIAKFYLDGAVAPCPAGVWPWHDDEEAQKRLEKMGKLKQTTCGDSTLISFRVKEYVDYLYNSLLNHPKVWLSENAINWINTYKTK